MYEENWDRLKSEIIKQAIKDWRYLDKGGEPDEDCNYKELIRFFENGCNGYVEPDTAEGILGVLLEEG